MLPRTAYVSSDILQQELQRLFVKRCYVGCLAEYAEAGAYRSFPLGDHALTCRAGAGGVSVFNNVCLHRNALIDPPGCGHKEFRCGYHGWRYGNDGQLLQTPLLDDSCIHNRQLQQFAVAEGGGLNFVALKGAAPDVSEVGDLLQRHELDFSVAPFHADSLLHECNWKLLVENVLEGYHLSFVHGDSFGEAGINSQAQFEAGQATYTLWSHTKPAKPAPLAALKHLPGALPQYLHGYIFPGTFVANTNNLIGYVGQLLPQAPDKTLLSWQLFELPALRALPTQVREQIKRDAITTALKVLLEDKPMVEACQQGLRSVGPEVQLQENEVQLIRFHEMYSRHMQA